MDTKTEVLNEVEPLLRDILANWKTVTTWSGIPMCPYCYSCHSSAWIPEQERYEIYIVHKPDCVYTRIAQFFGMTGRQNFGKSRRP